MASQQALALWKSQIPSYEKIIGHCCNRILTPLTRFLPPDFQQRIQQFKESLSMKEPDNYEKYIDVIVHSIEGKTNLSMISLADSLSQQFGGDLKYWQNVIIDVAQQISYTADLSIWHVRKIFQDKLFIDPETLSNNRTFCKITKSYLTAMITLIKGINKFDIKKDSISRLDDLFKKLKLAQEKYIGYTQKITQIIQPSQTMNQLSNNISMKSKQNALKDLYHFSQPSSNLPGKNKKGQNTLFNYKFKLKNKDNPAQRASGPTKNIKQTNKALTGIHLEQFQKTMKNIKNGYNTKSIVQLKDQFKENKRQSNHENTVNTTNFTSIWDKDYFFSFVSHPIKTQNFHQFLTPFQKQSWINYQINSEDEYQQLIGQDIDLDENVEMSQVSELSRNSFIVSDQHVDQQNLRQPQKEVEKKNYNLFGERWTFDRNTTDLINVINIPRSNFDMVRVDGKHNLQLIILQKIDIEQVLYRVVDGKDKQSIIQQLQNQNVKVSKAKLNKFLQKKCKQVKNRKNPSKSIYKIKQLHSEQEEEQQIQKQNKNIKFLEFLKNQEQNEKIQQQETNIYIHEYSSQVLNQPQRMFTRQFSKRQSLKCQNQTSCTSRRQSQNKRRNTTKSRSSLSSISKQI